MLILITSLSVRYVIQMFNSEVTIDVSYWSVVAGCGTGLWSSLMADIARITDSSERTGVMSIIMSVRQFGLIFGKSRK